MKTYKIGVVGGDGIGPEVAAEAVKVLQKIQDGFSLEFIDYPFGADHYLKTNEFISDKAMDEIRTLDAVLLGALGDPRCAPGVLERGILFRLRFGLDLYINYRPIKLYTEKLCPIKGKGPKDIDMVVCRENTEDAYSGEARFENKGTVNEVAIQEARYTWKGTERIIRFAFETARKRNMKKKVTLVDKANAVRAHDLLRRVFDHVAKDYPDIQKDNAYVDATCMWFVKNPEAFDVLVTTNMFGDIITDLGAMIQGGMGIAAGGNIHPGKVSVFEPIHGSAPKYKGLKKVSPLAAILSAGMLLEHLGQTKAADRVEAAVKKVLESDALPSIDASSGVPTDKVGDMVVAKL
ncbi:MAG TPA: 3-isopropylmalate dehydrogenase [Planctomycetota bacterium]|nr:3-isopropylmalate dehydrogenase [Planctomycetota bacterium]